MTTKKFMGVLIVAAMLLPFPLLAQVPVGVLKLKSRTVQTARGSGDFDAVKASLAAQGKVPLGGAYHAVVQFQQSPSAAQRAALSRVGVILHDYLPEKAYMATIAATTDVRQLEGYGVVHIGALSAQDKIEAELLLGQTGGTEAARAHVRVEIYPDLDPVLAAEEAARTHGAALISISDRVLHLTLPRSTLMELASAEWVKWIEGINEITYRANGSRALIKVNLVQDQPYNLKGSGIKFGLYDKFGVQSNHSALSSRVTILSGATTSTDPHATINAGLMIGNGAGSGSGSGNIGMAPEATLDFVNVSAFTTSGINWTSIFDSMKAHINQRNWVAVNNSYGDLNAPVGNYTTGSRLADEAVRLSNATIVFAVDYAVSEATPRSLRTPETAKNIIAVTAVDKNGGTFKPLPGRKHPACGPTSDGRIKPDIAAAGSGTSPSGPHIISTNIGTGSTYTNGFSEDHQGTSLAAPAITGGVGLIVQRYKQLNNNNIPSPALVKSILLNTAQEFQGSQPGPDYRHGFGIANILDAVKVVDALAYYERTISQGDVQEREITVPAGQSRLRVMMAYTDYEAAANAQTALVNQLNLKLISPSGVEWLPWVLNPNSFNSAATRAINVLDNVEQVEVSLPESGTWRIQVTAPNINQGSNQGYAVSWDNPVVISPTTVGINQRLSNGVQVGSIGRWQSNAFLETPVGSNGAQFSSFIGANEILRSSRDLFPNGTASEKYNNWNLSSNIVNPQQLLVLPDNSSFTANLREAASGAQLRAELIDAPNFAWGTIGFKDPWLIDFNDPPYGLRNRGMAAPFYDRSSPFAPDLTTAYPVQSGSATYKGVFLNQVVSGGTYYSARAQSSQTIGGYTGDFLGWAGVGATPSAPASLETPVVFTAPNAVVAARYKGRLLSSLAQASSQSGSQRRFARDVIAPSVFYLVYESAGKIWLTYSTNSGTSWQPERFVVL